MQSTLEKKMIQLNAGIFWRNKTLKLKISVVELAIQDSL
jgi:hypothetical protein